MPFGPLLRQPTPEVSNLMEQPFNPLIVALLDRTAECHLRLVEEEG